MRIFGAFVACFGLWLSWASETAQRSVIDVDQHQVHIAQWGTRSPETTTVVLLSGPTDQWNSDSAWFARLAPHLATTFHVLAIDRPGQVVNSANAPLGYAAFAKDVAAVLKRLQIKQMKIVAFASANITLNLLFADHPEISVQRVVMVDPDVLTPFSIGRYSSDAAPFKENLQKYREYIAAGSYAERALQKNDLERQHLRQLAGADDRTDWAYLEAIFAARLKTANLQNLFAEIAMYDEDLRQAAALAFPKHIPLTILDTDFEQGYIEKTEDEDALAGLEQWRRDGYTYYQKLVKAASKGRYIPLETKEHLLPFANPELLVKILAKP